MFIAEMISQFAQNEQNMNAVERVLHYSELPPEGAAFTPDDPPLTWPEKGHISFVDVKMTYREGLPLVLKGVSFEVRSGEKVNDYQLPEIVNVYMLFRWGLLDAQAQVISLYCVFPIELNITLGKSSLLQALFR